MAIRTNFQTIEKLKQQVAEIFVNNNDKITKIDQLSVFNAVAYAEARMAQIALKEIALVESELLPDFAFDSKLDNQAKSRGVAERFGASGSSTFVRLTGNVGTVYQVGVVNFEATNGVTFFLEKTETIGDAGFTYAKVRSQQTGSNTNVQPFSINRINNSPDGHQNVTNEYSATGGRDFEQDDAFRERIKKKNNLLALNTISGLEEALKLVNNNVLKIFYRGKRNGRLIFSILAQNGIDFTNQELNAMLLGVRDFFSFTELRPNGDSGEGIQFINTEYFPIDISARVELQASANPLDVIRNIQIANNKLIDFRFFPQGGRIEFERLLQNVSFASGIKYHFDRFFYPKQDIIVPKSKLPRFRGFLLLNEQGNIISQFISGFSPVFYPAIADFEFQQTALRTIR